MLNFIRSLRRKLIAEGNLKRYLIYAIGEILLVMIGILLALQVNNWNENQKSEDLKLQYFKNIKRHLYEDIDLIQGNISFNQELFNQFSYASKIIENNKTEKMDTLIKISLNLLQYSDIHRKSNIYETLVNSGEIKLLNNSKIIEHLQRLEGIYIYINRLEESHWDVIKLHIIPDIRRMVNLSSMKIENKEKIFGTEHLNTFLLIKGLMEEKNEKYHLAIDEMNATLKMLESEIQ